MDMRVIEQLLGPGMENGKYADGRANKTRVAGKLDDRLRRCLHERGIAVPLVAP